MRSSLFRSLALVSLPVAFGLNIIVNNDDGFGAANIRELYRLLKAEGHNVILVAPVVDNSGQGGRSQFTNLPTLTTPSEYNLIPAGAPSLGTDPADSHIWYYNGTPAATTFVALDYVAPLVWGPNVTADLLVAGPNVGTNLGPFLYTLSGTEGATYAAVGRGIPAIAFSASSEGGQRSYLSINKTTPSGYPDPATINAQLSVNLVNKLIQATPRGQRLLPIGYGLTVNYPYITSLTNASCVKPPFIQTRLTGGALSDLAVVSKTINGTPIFTYGDVASAGVNADINGDFALPGETPIVDDNCESSVTPFTVDYDAPSNLQTAGVRTRLFPLVEYRNLTKPGHAKRGLAVVSTPEI